jgi:prepilin-type N-terminal cleavage/methylation domain-containing protein
MKKFITDKKGFTLIELLVAVAILGLVLMAISTTFINQRRGGLTQEDVTEAQQSARIGLETLVRGIRGSGLLIPKNGSVYPVDNAGSFNITLTMGSAMEVYATIENPTDADGNIGGLTSPITFIVNNARDFEYRSGADVMIIRPTEGMEPGSREEGAKNVCYTVTYLTPTTLMLTYKSGTLPTGGIPDINFRPGDTIVLHDCAAVSPIRTRYYFVPDPVGAPGTTVMRSLVRHVDANNNGIVDGTETGEVIVTNIIVPDADADGTPDLDANGRQIFPFIYLDRNGNETTNVANITAVNVDITASTSRNVAQINNANRTRRLTSLVRIKNKFD